MDEIVYRKGMDEDIDPKAEIERYLIERTCERCDRTFDKALTFHLVCLIFARKGYTLRHFKRWRVCDLCAFGHSFGKWIFPVIQNLLALEHESLASIMRVQPLSIWSDPPSLDLHYRFNEPPFPLDLHYGFKKDDPELSAANRALLIERC